MPVTIVVFNVIGWCSSCKSEDLLNSMPEIYGRLKPFLAGIYTADLKSKGKEDKGTSKFLFAEIEGSDTQDQMGGRKLLSCS